MPVTGRDRPLLRPAVAALALALLVAASLAAHAGAGPFGVGLPDTTAPAGGGLLSAFLMKIAFWQSGFYRSMTATLRAMKSDGTAGFWLVGLSFAYGIFHAAGPGHGKAVISAYVLANRQSVRNGALLAMASALAQAVSAVLLVSVAAIVIGATSIAMTRAAQVFEIGSFGLISALGAWMVAVKIVVPLARLYRRRYAPVAIAPPAGPAAELAVGAGACRHGHLHGIGDGALACGCANAHMPEPETAAGPLDWRKAASTIAAVGIRPCTGALIVLVFALSQGIYAAGIVATFAMAIGTGLTVSTLTLATIFARRIALRLAAAGNGGSHRFACAQGVIEALAAGLILAFGLTMLAASLYNL